MTGCDNISYPSFEADWDFSDLLVESDGNIFHVHKGVLSMWSPHLKAQILDMAAAGEKDPMTLKLPKFCKSTVQIMLQTIYPPNRPIMDEEVEDLVDIANKLQMLELMRRCEKFLLQRIATPDLLILAQKHTLSKLLAKCIEQCGKMPLDELKSSVVYAQIQSTNLANILEQRCVRVDKKLKRSEARCWELSCTLRAVVESWKRKEGACSQHQQKGMHQENCNECLHAIRRQIDRLCDLALDTPSQTSD